MEFKVIPNEQTPAVPDAGILLEHEINIHRKELNAFLEFASTRGNAVGLAANQCAIDDKRFMLRVFALGGKERNWRLVINPVITKYIGLADIKVEGCLTWKDKLLLLPEGVPLKSVITTWMAHFIMAKSIRDLMPRFGNTKSTILTALKKTCNHSIKNHHQYLWKEMNHVPVGVEKNIRNVVYF